MEQAEKTMIENLHKNTGKSLEAWIKIVKAQTFEKHGQIVKFLKENHSFTHGFANMVALKAREADAGSAADVNDLVEAQYVGKEHFKPLYEKLLAQIKQFGSDVEVAPKKAYVSLKRKKQFAMLQPATKTRFEIGLNLKSRGADGKLEPITKSNAMFTHLIKITSEEEADNKVLNWLKEAYEQAG